MIYIPNKKYNPDNTEGRLITSKLPLGKSVSIATFLAHGASGIGHIGTAAKRSQLARNLYLHAELMNSINQDTKLFKDVRVTVSEGIYEAGPYEVVKGDNKLKEDGRLVVYQVYNRKGKIDHPATFDVAKFWKDHMEYSRLVLDYDFYNPDGTMTSQILVEMPTVPSTWDIKFTKVVQTQYNGRLLSNKELVEVLESV